MPNLLLVWPRTRDFPIYERLIPTLTVPYLAGLTPPHWTVRFADDNYGEVEAEAADLVGISVNTMSAHRAYALADRFRGRGIPVVLGGWHVTFCPDEAAAHADAVVVGEADDVWCSVLADAERGTLRSRYVSRNDTDLARYPRVRRDLLDGRRYFTQNLVQATRGCPYRCSFCSVSTINPKYRRRPIADVVEEVRQLDGRTLFFIDDNLFIHRTYTRQLFEALVPLGRRWVGEASIDLADDPALLDLAVASGMTGLLVGFESVLPGSLREMNKHRTNRADRYRQQIDALQSRGVGVLAMFTFGFDEDGPDVFERTPRLLRGGRRVRRLVRHPDAVSRHADVREARGRRPHPHPRLAPLRPPTPGVRPAGLGAWSARGGRARPRGALLQLARLRAADGPAQTVSAPAAAGEPAAIGELSAAVAHGIRNPLAGIRLAAQLGLEAAAAADPVRESFDDVLGAVDRLEAQVRGILDFARPFEPRLEPLDLPALAGSVLDAAAARLEASGVTVALDVPPSLPRVLADRAHLAQAMQELLSNAVDAMPQGGRVTIDARADDGNPPLVRLGVQDEGPGVPPEVRDRIFQLFMTTKSGGTGVGLAVVRKIMERHGGRVTLEPSAGRGARFVLELPAASL